MDLNERETNLIKISIKRSLTGYIDALNRDLESISQNDLNNEDDKWSTDHTFSGVPKRLNKISETAKLYKKFDGELDEISFFTEAHKNTCTELKKLVDQSEIPNLYQSIWYDYNENVKRIF